MLPNETAELMVVNGSWIQKHGMSQSDKDADIAERYVRMLEEDPGRRAFFGSLFERYRVRSILDCSCGTGNDLLLFHSMGHHVVGSDLSDSTLRVSANLIKGYRAEKILKNADFHDLKTVHSETFDAVVCLSNSMNELEVDPVAAPEGMKAVLNANGIIVVDQGRAYHEQQGSVEAFRNEPFRCRHDSTCV